MNGDLVNVVAIRFATDNQYLLLSNIRVNDEPEGPKNTIENVLKQLTERFQLVFQIVKAKLPKTKLCEAINLASEGFVCLVYGEYQVLGTTEWRLVFLVVHENGHVAVISGFEVCYQPSISIETLARAASYPKVLGVPDLY
ncbi:hypothetical protein THRCLA_20787 [Thraustotheca clavata]|uniref:Uncharacterized protein n=1 Tax=Thraustotheca clavata TaxID=74557 RepID=A0A1W0A3G0_9STRA|nr:hypothetical protein THRCLA_20787 [Thraustotheca clavata]